MVCPISRIISNIEEHGMERMTQSRAKSIQLIQSQIQMFLYAQGSPFCRNLFAQLNTKLDVNFLNQPQKKKRAILYSTEHEIKK